jgi:hypothetical protein
MSLTHLQLANLALVFLFLTLFPADSFAGCLCVRVVVMSTGGWTLAELGSALFPRSMTIANC